MSPPGANIQSSAVYSGVPSAPAWQQNSAAPLAAIPDFHMAATSSAASSSETLQFAMDLAFLYSLPFTTVSGHCLPLFFYSHHI
jgi:hypothetical protein